MESSIIANFIKPFHLIVVEDQPCQVIQNELVKSGKHGAAKPRIVYTNLFTKQQGSVLFTMNQSVPLLEYLPSEFRLLDFEEEKGSFSNKSGEIIDDVNLSSDFIGKYSQMNEEEQMNIVFRIYKFKDQYYSTLY